MGPKAVNESFGLFVFAFDVESPTDGILAGEFDDAACEGILAPGFEALLKDVGAIVVKAVALGFVVAAGADEEGVFGFGDGECFPDGLGHYWRN
ncbi:MAG TPA: hypothetical protein DCL08_01785 [Anaerolineaceae bacterium]|nr:hypothetical protein [Anaerolineaceae bacterium]